MNNLSSKRRGGWLRNEMGWMKVNKDDTVSRKDIWQPAPQYDYVVAILLHRARILTC